MDKHTLFKVVGGSHMAGLATENSDLDTYTVVAYEPNFYMGLPGHSGRPKQKVTGEGADKSDETEFELRHFVGMCVKGNPTHLRLLWGSDADYLECSSVGEMLRQRRHRFSARSAGQPFVGMATGYFQRAKARVGLEVYPDVTSAKELSNAFLLLHQVCEFMQNGILPVFMDYSVVRDLRRVREGKYTMAESSEKFLTLRRRADSAVAASMLPAEVDTAYADWMCVHALSAAWREMGVTLGF